MKQNFSDFASSLKLSEIQENDARTKYNGVCKKVHDMYYPNRAYDGSTKFLFGSYKQSTNITPIVSEQDVDVLIKLPETVFERFDAYSSNGQAALLQEIRNVLNEKYTTTDGIKAWGKVILVPFADRTHNVELLPAFENSDGTFRIPNSEQGGKWENFNPRAQINQLNTSNTKTNGLAKEMVRMLKSWVRNVSTLNYPSYQIEKDVVVFLEQDYTQGASFEEYPKVFKNFFEYYKNRVLQTSPVYTHLKTAHSHSVKAIEYQSDDSHIEASNEWQKVFGTKFPKSKSNPPKSESRNFSNPSSPWSY